MIAIVLDTNKHIIYTYNDDDADLSILQALELLKNGKCIDGNKIHSHLYIQKTESNRVYHIFFNDTGNLKEAKYRAKIIIKGIKDYALFSLKQADLSEYIDYSIFHNTKNIIHHISNGLKKVINYEELLLQDNKVDYINNLINNHSITYARELLAISKSLEQISFEYNIIDYIKPGILLVDSDKTRVKIHSLIVQAYYIYEQQFMEKSIKVIITPDYTEIKCNFFTMRSAFALILENCLKYCVENSDISIKISRVADIIKIDIIMQSVYNNEEEIERMFLPKERGGEAKKKSKGNGIGLYIAKRLCNLNSIELYFRKLNSWNATKNSIKYCNNIFVIDVPNSLEVKGTT